MGIEEWWPKLQSEARDYLIANNGDVVPPKLVQEIAGAGGAVSSDVWWLNQGGPDGLVLSDEAVAWIEEVANGETPRRREDDRS